MKLTQYLAPMLAATGLAYAAAVPAPAAQAVPPGPGQCQDIDCTGAGTPLCNGQGCGFIQAGGTGFCLDPEIVQTSKEKREAEIAERAARVAAKPANLFRKREAEAVPQTPQPPAPGQCQDVSCSNNDVCNGIGCGNCFIMSGGGICLDPGLAAPPPGSTSKKRDAEAAPQAPQPPAPGQCQDVACSNNDVCNGIGCGNCFIMSGGGICLDPGLAAPPPGSTS